MHEVTVMVIMTMVANKSYRHCRRLINARIMMAGTHKIMFKHFPSMM
jgi:hypothetical protein